MLKIGLIYCAYNCEKYLEESLKNWIFARKDKLEGNEFVICAVSVPFEEYISENIPADKTIDLLTEYYNRFEIDNLITEPKYVKEHIIRDKALQYLLQQGCTDIVLFDGDEFITLEQLTDIINFVKLEPWISWFSFSYKNFVFDKNTYLKDAFTPPRWFRVKTNGYELKQFYWDNDAIYYGVMNKNSQFINKTISYKELPNKVISKFTVFLDHYTWLNDERSKQKVAYQLKHFGHCSFAWDDSKGGLIFDENFYKQNNLDLPKLVKISN